MSAKVVTIGGYVRLDIRAPGDFGFARVSGFARSEADCVGDLEKLARAASLRLSKFDDEFGGAHVVLERESRCEFCGYGWTEASLDYNGGCCAADQDAEEARAAIAKAPEAGQ